MAGKIIADTIEASGSQISLNVGNVTVFTASSTGLATANITTANITTANITGNLLVGTTTAQTGAKLSVTGGIQGTITSGTTVASTSGTSIDFTSIPSWVKRVTVMFSGVSVSGTSAILLQLGTSSGVETSGYISYGAITGGATLAGGTTSTAGFIIFSNAAGNLFYGQVSFISLGSNAWVGAHVLGLTSGGLSYSVQGGGNKTTAATLDRVRITTVNGTDTFDAGTINILYEG